MARLRALGRLLDEGKHRDPVGPRPHDPVARDVAGLEDGREDGLPGPRVKLDELSRQGRRADVEIVGIGDDAGLSAEEGPGLEKGVTRTAHLGLAHEAYLGPAGLL